MKGSRRTYRITALVLALLVFGTSTGFSVDIHYCQGKVKSFSFFGKARGCSDLEMIVPTCAHHEKSIGGDELSRRKCCENASQYFQANQNLITQSASFPAAQQAPAVSAQLEDTLGANTLTDERTRLFSRYKPPPLLRDIQVLSQVFLI